MDVDSAEYHTQSRRRTPSFYVVLFCLVIPVWSSIPLSWLFVLYVLWSGTIWSFAWPARTLFVVALSEVFFSVYHFHLSRAVSGTVPFAVGDLTDIHIAVKRLLTTGLAHLPVNATDEDMIQLEPDDPLAVDFRNTMRTWFRKAPWSSVKLHEVRKWLYWSIFNADMPPLETLSTSQRAILDRTVDLLQKRSGYIFQEGSNPAAQPMRVTIDDVNILWRPFTFYMAIFSINFCFKKLYEFVWDTHYGHRDGLEYLIRIPKHWDPVTGPRPTVFLHGLGLGLMQYNSMIMHLLQRFPDRPLLVLLQPHISQDIFHPRYLKPMNRHQTADRLAALMNELGWVHHDSDDDETKYSEEEKEIAYLLNGKRNRGVTMMSHSNGSYIHAWMLKGYPKMIGRSCFADPVTFCSWEGDVCYNFVYRPCTTGIEVLMRYFVGAELGVANLIQRHFDWVSNSLWYEEIPNARDPSKTLFLLGGKDVIVHSKRVKRYLTFHGVNKGIWYDPNGMHGQVLLSGSRGHNEILRWLREEET
ncbi:hypothetical protein Hypma_010101 [Hypsizygus marmoreus]|uniref:AB hydrolase-1 domain-containing protein n=1 Tax=Hypsizygus marmoreus TaxID=39966 RepID=A0A369JTI1_HYPMA|nr:hypothetical protein Hypma_010101 [Hypsizygus marmoreus]